MFLPWEISVQTTFITVFWNLSKVYPYLKIGKCEHFNMWILKGAKLNFYELKKTNVDSKWNCTIIMLTKPHTMTIMSSNTSNWVNGNVVCRSLNFLILHITRSTWICTLDSCLDVFSSPPESCFFLFVKLGILKVTSATKLFFAIK